MCLAIYSIYFTLFLFGGSCSNVSYKGAALKNCSEFTEKQLCGSLFLTESSVSQFLIETLAKFSRTVLLQNTCGRLLLLFTCNLGLLHDVISRHLFWKPFFWESERTLIGTVSLNQVKLVSCLFSFLNHASFIAKIILILIWCKMFSKNIHQTARAEALPKMPPFFAKPIVDKSVLAKELFVSRLSLIYIFQRRS